MPFTRTALITGASSGIGAEFARRFAAAGTGVILVARRVERLESLARELRDAHGVPAHVVAADLSERDAAARLVARLDELGLPIHALVNSAGLGTDGPVSSEVLGRVQDEVRVNVDALTELTVLLLPRLLSVPDGILLNVSSTAAYQPLPNMAVYAASKAYVTSFTEAIWRETRGTGLRVLALAPGPTETEFFETAGSDRFKIGPVIEVGPVVDAAFRALRRRDPGPSVIVGTGNRLTALGARLVPRRLTLAVGARLTSDIAR